MAPDLVKIKPRRLKANDTVGIVAPSSPMFEESRMEFVFKWLEKLGLKYKLGKHLFDHHGDLAGHDEDRLFDFHSMWGDKEVDAIMAVRGGTGSVRLISDLDFELIRRNPKIFIGFSDITFLKASTPSIISKERCLSRVPWANLKIPTARMDSDRQHRLIEWLFQKVLPRDRLSEVVSRLLGN